MTIPLLLENFLRVYRQLGPLQIIGEKQEKRATARKSSHNTRRLIGAPAAVNFQKLRLQSDSDRFERGFLLRVVTLDSSGEGCKLTNRRSQVIPQMKPRPWEANVQEWQQRGT